MNNKLNLRHKGVVIISGKVIKGRGRGKNLGFPTANIALNNNVEEGIYISQTEIEEKIYPSITFIGKAETFNETEVLVETHILDFDKNVYNRLIKVKLLKKIREGKKFTKVEDLILQIKNDEEEARNYFNLE